MSHNWTTLRCPKGTPRVPDLIAPDFKHMSPDVIKPSSQVGATGHYFVALVTTLTPCRNSCSWFGPYLTLKRARDLCSPKRWTDPIGTRNWPRNGFLDQWCRRCLVATANIELLFCVDPTVCTTHWLPWWTDFPTGLGPDANLPTLIWTLLEPPFSCGHQVWDVRTWNPTSLFPPYGLGIPFGGHFT